jgi:tetratricopeptide (TPR) repeat protein
MVFTSCMLLLAAIYAFPQCSTGRRSTKFNLIGRVLNAATGAEVGQALVWAESRGQRRMAVTDAQGRFYFDCLDPGLYDVQITRDGFQPAQAQFDVLSGTNSDAVVRIQPAVKTIRQPVGNTLSAREAQVPREAHKFFDDGVEQLYRKKRPERSVEYFQKAIEIYPDYDEAYVQLGIAHTRASRPQEAEQTFRKAIAMHSKNARAYVFLGKLYYEQGKLDQAAEELLRVVKIDNTLWLGHLDLARILGKQGKLREAYQHAQLAHELYKGIQDVHLVYYNACVNNRDYAAALTELDEFVRLYPDSDVAKKMRAVRDRLAEDATAKRNP